MAATDEEVHIAPRRAPARLLTEAEMGAFERDGVVKLSGVVDPAWVEKLQTMVERTLSACNPSSHGASFDEHGRLRAYSELMLWQRDEVAADWCLRSPLPALAAQLFRADHVNLLFDHLLVREPGSAGEITPWHNDQPYWAIRGNQICSFWMALDHVTADSGAVQYVRGSHRDGRWYSPVGFVKGSPVREGRDLPAVPDIEAHREDYDIVWWELEPGDLLVHHGLILHYAPSNESDRRRRGYSVRYTGPDVTYDPHDAAVPNMLHNELTPGGPIDCAAYPVVWDVAPPTTSGDLSR